MPANVENMFSVGETPWHNLGIVLDSAPTIKQGLELSGLDTNITLRKLCLEDGTPVPNAMVTVRDTDNSQLGIVGPRYKVLQNREAFEWFQPFLDEGLATLETAGSLRGGQRVWVMAKLTGGNLDIVKNRDSITPFLMLSNSHDGTMAVRVGYTPIRIVCDNTLAMAHSSDASKLIRCKHSANMQTNLENIREIMNVAHASFEATAEQYRALTKRSINQNDLRNYVIESLEIKMDDGKISTRSENMIKDIEALFIAGKGADIAGVRGTVWGAYNAVNQYLNYDYGHNQDSRLNALWFGSSAATNKRALGLALKMAS